MFDCTARGDRESLDSVRSICWRTHTLKRHFMTTVVKTVNLTWWLALTCDKCLWSSKSCRRTCVGGSPKPHFSRWWPAKLTTPLWVIQLGAFFQNSARIGFDQATEITSIFNAAAGLRRSVGRPRQNCLTEQRGQHNAHSSIANASLYLVHTRPGKGGST